MSLIHKLGYLLLKWPPVRPEVKRAAHDALFSRVCACGKKKPSGFAFCRECWEAFDAKTRERLSRNMLRRGFVIAYIGVRKRVYRTTKSLRQQNPARGER